MLRDSIQLWQFRFLTISGNIKKNIQVKPLIFSSESRRVRISLIERKKKPWHRQNSFTINQTSWFWYQNYIDYQPSDLNLHHQPSETSESTDSETASWCTIASPKKRSRLKAWQQSEHSDEEMVLYNKPAGMGFWGFYIACWTVPFFVFLVSHPQ